MAFIKQGDGTILSVIDAELPNNDETKTALEAVKEQVAKIEKDTSKQDKKLES